MKELGRLTAEAQRTRRDVLFCDPIVRGDWITRLSPSGIDSDSFDRATAKRACSDAKKAFYLAASHRQIKKMTSWRPLRLRGENPNLDRTDFCQ